MKTKKNRKPMRFFGDIKARQRLHGMIAIDVKAGRITEDQGESAKSAFERAILERNKKEIGEFEPDGE